MSYKSKYFNIDKYFKNTASKKNWDKNEFVFAVEVLESLSRVLLFKLLDEFKICFTVPKEREKFLEDEEIISVLISDVPKEKLLKKFREMIEEPPLKFKIFSFRSKNK